jgi:hypothetical protein
MRRLVLTAVAVALAVPASASAEVTIAVGKGKYQEQKYRETFYPGGFRLKGKTGAFRGQVQLEVDEFPFGGFVDSGTATTNDKGEYVFPKVVLTRNSKVRVRAAGERSKTLDLFVHPGIKQSGNVSSDGRRYSFSWTYIGHPGFTPASNNSYVYIHKVKERKLRRIGGPVTMSQIADGRWRWKGKLTLPASKRTYEFYTYACTQGLSAAGYGRPWPLDQKCGQKTISG